MDNHKTFVEKGLGKAQICFECGYARFLLQTNAYLSNVTGNLLRMVSGHSQYKIFESTVKPFAEDKPEYDEAVDGPRIRYINAVFP